MNKLCLLCALAAVVIVCLAITCVEQTHARPNLVALAEAAGFEGRCNSRVESREDCRECCAQFGKRGKIARWDGTNIEDTPATCQCRKPHHHHRDEDDVGGSYIRDGREIGLFNNL